MTGALLALACAIEPIPEPGVPPPTPAWQIVARHPEVPAVVAHRGASEVAPENTLAAYREALARGALAAETDVHLSADGHVVVIHDATLRRTTGAEGAVAETEWEAIRALDAGSWFGDAFAGEPVPELGELLDLVRGRMVLCVEIKAGTGIVEAVRRHVDARGMRPEVIVFSFDARAVREAKATMPDVPAVFLARPAGEPPTYGTAAVDAARATGADAVGFAHRFLGAEAVDAAHAAGLPVFTWTVNAAEDLDRVRALGVDVVISDAPDRVTALLQSANP